MTITIIGAGLAGATLAHELAVMTEHDIAVYDERNHVGGNVHTERDPSTGVMVHKYGPHIFHTDNLQVWEYVRRFADFRPYIQRTKAQCRGDIYSWPLNLHTINQFYGRNFRPDEARKHLEMQFSHPPQGIDPTSFEAVATAGLGGELYRAFFYGYTRKQWGRDPATLPGSILKRLPLRLDYNDNAYFHRYQGIPVYGYTKMVENMLDHPRIKVHLGEKLERYGISWRSTSSHVFNSGALDEWFRYVRGPLAYRTLDLETIVDLSTKDYQGCSVINSCDLSTPWTRSTEHRHFTPWEVGHSGTVVTREFPREWDMNGRDIRYYPVHLTTDDQRLKEYQELAAREKDMTFIGRLGTYRYLDMDQTIWESMEAARRFLRR